MKYKIKNNIINAVLLSAILLNTNIFGDTSQIIPKNHAKSQGSFTRSISKHHSTFYERQNAFFNLENAYQEELILDDLNINNTEKIKANTRIRLTNTHIKRGSTVILSTN